ncbi:PREDICTED: vacuolar protein sorting-associated protein 8 homolog isoform X2 [Nicrophorus vespilloides]|nr:PREDICTED: vacuolar protein sorting-associated protein 8 homolog isoform X2 [Nicrophorus vespilloides]
MESEEGSDSTSLHSLQSLTLRFRSMLYHCILQGISSQISSANDRVNAGLPTVITNSLKYVAVGTSHGYVLAFDTEQKLCWCSHDNISNDQGAISALAFNLDSTRLLVGFERGYILMLDTSTGDVLRRLPDAHAPQTAVLQLRFTSSNSLALIGDSSGCVFSLNFSRRLGVRSWDSKCLFSGARGEVCCFEPLTQAPDMLGQFIVVALATLSKIIIITVKPRLRVLYSHQLPRIPTSLPVISWQLVLVGKSWQPVLAWGRGSELNYTRITFAGVNKNKMKLSSLRSVQLSYSMTAIHWIGNRHLAILDTGENLRLVEVRTQKELEFLELNSAGLVYSSAHFKALAVGGGVSEAFALAGDRACYNSLSSRGDQLLVLGTRAVHMVKLRTWHERLLYLSDQGRWTEALNLAADEGMNREKSTTALLEKYLISLSKHFMEKESIAAAINCCVKLQKNEVLCNGLWDVISTDHANRELFFTIVTDHVNCGALTHLSPSVTQALVAYLNEKSDLIALKNLILSLDLSCLDLHQVLSICKKRKLYEAWIHITTKTINDYTGPLTEFLDELTPDNHALGNTLLVYISACLAGLGYPKGSIPKDEILRVKFDVLRCLEALHSVSAREDEQTYPYLRALLKYNIRECLNVIKLAFTENEFSGEMGLLQRQRLMEILMLIVSPPEFDESQITILACFIARLVTSNNLKVEEKNLNTVIDSLTNITEKPLSQRDHNEREQAWLDLLNARKLNHFDTDQLLEIALQSNCFKVAEYVYELKQDYSHILACYLKDPDRKNDVFNYIVNYVNDTDRSIRDQFLDNFESLIAIDCKKCMDIVIEHFVESIEDLYNLLDGDDLYVFSRELILNEVKISPKMAETYLELMCTRDVDAVCSFLQMGFCRVEKALEITQRNKIHSAAALLLEQMGEFRKALDLLLEHNLTDLAVDLCIRGADHLDSETSQSLWLALLKYPRTSNNYSLRQLLHSAAPHVPPAQLLELVSDANFGDIKSILKGILTDCQHDIDVLTTTLKLLGKDLHQGLAKTLCASGKGLSVARTICNMCQSHLKQVKSEEQVISVWGCGHIFHGNCINLEDKICPVCRNEAVSIELNVIPKVQKEEHFDGSSQQARPDLEGHF